MDIGTSSISVSNWDDTVWHHFIISKAEGIWIDGEKKGDFSPTTTIKGELLINGVSYDTDGTRNANGCFGMIKIDDAIIIPTADGFLNTNTGELLEVVKDGGYNFTENLPTYPEDGGELYKTINVNIDVDSYYNNGYNQGKTDGVNEQKSKLETINITENGTYRKEDGYNEVVVDVPGSSGNPKINVKEAGLKFGQSTFTEVPEWADFEGITDMAHMFNNCTSLETIPLLNTSNVTNMGYMFHNCGNLQTIPQLDTSKVTNMNRTFSNCASLQTIPQLDTSNVTDMSFMLNIYGGMENLVSLPKFNCQKVTNIRNYFSSLNMSALTDVGGWENLKCNWNDGKGLNRLPNLTYESCINVLNGLYDFTGNGETPNSDQGKLKVHQNFLDKVGDEISIGVNKGWVISA